MTADVLSSVARCRLCRFTLCRSESRYTPRRRRRRGLRNQLLHLCVARSRRGRAGCSPSAEYAGKCNAPGCTKVTKCHLPKATRCASLQASSRRPVCNYMFLFFLPTFVPLFLLLHYLATTGPVRTYVRASERAVAGP